MRFVGHAYQPHLPIAVCEVLVGKGRQRMHVTDTRIQVSDTMQHKRMGYVLWRALVLALFTLFLNAICQN